MIRDGGVTLETRKPAAAARELYRDDVRRPLVMIAAGLRTEPDTFNKHIADNQHPKKLPHPGGEGDFFSLWRVADLFRARLVAHDRSHP